MNNVNYICFIQHFLEPKKVLDLRFSNLAMLAKKN